MWFAAQAAAAPADLEKAPIPLLNPGILECVPESQLKGLRRPGDHVVNPAEYKRIFDQSGSESSIHPTVCNNVETYGGSLRIR